MGRNDLIQKDGSTTEPDTEETITEWCAMCEKYTPWTLCAENPECLKCGVGLKTMIILGGNY